MASNIELELQLRAAQKHIQELRTEIEALKSASASTVSADLRVLRDALNEVFRNVGFSADWAFAQRKTAPAAPVIAAQINKEVAPARISALPTAAEWQQMNKEITGRDLPKTPEEWRALIQENKGAAQPQKPAQPAATVVAPQNKAAAKAKPPEQVSVEQLSKLPNMQL